MTKSNSASLLNSDKAAKYLGLKPSTLDVWACTGRYNLKYIKVGRLRKYRQEDLDEFLTLRTVSTKEEN